MMMTPEEHAEALEEGLRALQEDVALLQLALLGAEVSIDGLILRCLLRLSDGLKHHLDRICTLGGQ